MKIAVLSDGSWGTALARLLCLNGHQVTLWGPFPENIREIRANRENKQFLPGVPLPDNLGLEDDMASTVDGAELILLATPSQYLRSVLELLQPLFQAENQSVVNVAKGIEVATLKRMSELSFELLGDCSYAVLSGPSHAEEVAKNAPTAVVVASKSDETAKLIQECFMNDTFRVYSTDDIIGVELGGSLKNVFALAAGVIDGMKLGDNSKAALITRGLAEMARLGVALGGRFETFSGLSGLGDLVVTCASQHSRNRYVGEELGKGKKLPDIIEAMGMTVAEGVKTTKSAFELASKIKVETPIVSEIHAMLYEGKDPGIALKDLMTRKARPESD